MNFKALESATKLRGGYYTDQGLATYLLRWALEIRPQRLLEPSVGDGAFLRALSRIPHESLERVMAFEVVPEEAAKARATAGAALDTTVDVQARDFLGWFLTQAMRGPQFDAAVGNPPFIRYQYLDEAAQERAQRVFELFGLPFTKHTNAWVPFIVASVALLRPGGRLAMVAPAELLHVLHAQGLRSFLAQQCSRLVVVDPEEIWFGNTLQGAVLLLAERKSSAAARYQGVGIASVRGRGFCTSAPGNLWESTATVDGATVHGKWMPALLTHAERGVLEQAAHHADVHPFAEVASVDVGIVTGANKFFLVPDETVAQYELWDWAHPMFGRSDHVPGVVYDDAVHAENRRRGKPTNFLWFPDGGEGALSSGARRYLRAGEAQGLHQRYKCRIRTPWYRVPSVRTAPVGLLKRCHHYPRLILNTANAFTTDTAYRVSPNDGQAARLVSCFVNSLTALSAELEGRHYGGGVLELVPSEIEKLLLPMPRGVPADIRALDTSVRTAEQPDALLRDRDSRLLAPLGLGALERDTLRGAWQRLVRRRQRVADAAGEDGAPDAD